MVSRDSAIASASHQRRCGKWGWLRLLSSATRSRTVFRGSKRVVVLGSLSDSFATEMAEEKNKTQKGDNEFVESAGLDTGSLPYREHLRGLERSLEEVRALRERSLALEGQSSVATRRER